MILGPLKSSQAGNRLQAKHCVRSANVPASPHHQKPVESSPSRPPCSTLSLLPQTSTHQGLALPEQEDTHEEVQQVVRASILAAPGAQCRLMCCTAAHKIEQPHHAGVCRVRFTTDGARLPEDSSSHQLILDSSPASDPEEGEGSRLRKPIIVSLIYNNCLFSSVSNLQ